MNEGASMMYQSNGGFSGPFMMSGGVERQGPRQYPLDVLHVMGNSQRGACSPAPGVDTPRRGQARHDGQPSAKGENIAFGYESDDSSLSSNASGSNKSTEQGDSSQDRQTVGVYGSSGGVYAREWRARSRRDHPRPRRFAPDRYLECPYPFQVKYTPDDLLNGSKWDTLSQEIWDKFVKSQQTEETFRNKMSVWRYLYVTIKSIFPRYGLYVVGSTMSGFGLESSDMDLCLYVRPREHSDAREHALLHLNCILQYMKQFDTVFSEAELIQAKVPILKFREHLNGLNVDLNCNNVVGIRNTNLLYCFSRLDWRVRPLVVVAKLWARAHDINDARRRTLSSYSITLMMLHYLQYGASLLPGGMSLCRAVPRASRASLGELWAGFLRYYAAFPFDKMAVSVRLGAPLPIAACRAHRAHKNDPHQWKLICVEEPFDLTNTARSVYDPETFERIVSAFRSSAARLASAPRLASTMPAP